MSLFAHNLRRLMAQFDLTVDAVARRSGLDDRTIKGLLAGRGARPHARTLHRLAAGLGVATDELFRSPGASPRGTFDRHTNTAVDRCIVERPDLFASFSDADFAELYSQVGTGGGLTAEGAARVAEAINRKRDLHDKLALLLETEQADLVASILELLCERVRVTA
ncbi:MAG: helix-turn-helix transcriptional regulator [Planctomycetia bacterium]|nr:helix-turn-helix transcriptional regulator [Planctomycetia bacterium]